MDSGENKTFNLSDVLTSEKPANQPKTYLTLEQHAKMVIESRSLCSKFLAIIPEKWREKEVHNGNYDDIDEYLISLRSRLDKILPDTVLEYCPGDCSKRNNGCAQKCVEFIKSLENRLCSDI